MLGEHADAAVVEGLRGDLAGMIHTHEPHRERVPVAGFGVMGRIRHRTDGPWWRKHGPEGPIRGGEQGIEWRSRCHIEPHYKDGSGIPRPVLQSGDCLSTLSGLFPGPPALCRAWVVGDP